MGGCSVRGCSNSSKKGYLMKLVPRNKERREIWLRAINRPSLTTSVAASVCETHFDKDAWEKTRVDGSRKLKWNAVPTLLLDNSARKQRDGTTQSNQSCIRVVIQKPAAEKYVFENLGDIDVHATDETDPHHSNTDDIPVDRDDKSTLKNLTVLENMSEMSNRDPDPRNNILKKYEMRLRMLKKKLRLCRAENKRLAAKAASGTAFRRIFNDDQIEIIQNKYKKCRKWSNETLTRALKLKFACGNNGYNELRRQKFPLPSIRTLSNKIQHINVSSEVQYNEFELLKSEVSSVDYDDESECSMAYDEIITEYILTA